LFMVRNHARPMFYATTRDAITVFGSEEYMIGWLVNRNYASLENMFELVPLTLYEFKGTLQPSKSAKYSVYVPPVSYHTARNKTNNSVNKVTNNVLDFTGGYIALEDTPFSSGERISFMYEGIQVPREKSKHGRVFGTELNSAMRIVGIGALATGTEEERSQYLWTGKVVRAVRGEGGEIIVYVARPEQTNILDPFYETVSLPPDEEVPALEAPSKSVSPDNHVPGPNGILIPARDFDRLTARGCCNCGGNVMAAQAAETLWTFDNRPVCSDCCEAVSDSGAVRRH